MGFSLAQREGSALRAGVLSFASPKESSQRKGDPWVGALRVPCATRQARGLRNSGYALKQCSPFFRASLRCSAPLKGARKASRLDQYGQKLHCCGRPAKKAKNETPTLVTDVLPGPLKGAEQRRSAGGFWLALSEPQASLASLPAFRVAQGIPAGDTAPGSPSFCLLFLGEARKSEAPSKAEPQANRSHKTPNNPEHS
jgi:hypothetical protein